MKRIDPNNKIFKSEEYKKDSYMFYIIEMNFPSPDLMLYSDEENYVVCRGKEGLPTWIWTKDNIEEEKMNEIKKVMDLYLTDRERDYFTCKKDLYDYLSSNYENLNKEDYFETGFLICSNPKKPKECGGKIEKGTMKDLNTLVDMMYKHYEEIEDISMDKTYDDAKERILEKLEKGSMYVWKDSNDEIVSIAFYSIIGDKAKLAGAYTNKDKRGKGYMANLIYEMTNEILDKGLVPLLYTDYKYIPSNKAYKNAGYEDKGILIEFSCSKTRAKNL